MPKDQSEVLFLLRELEFHNVCMQGERWHFFDIIGPDIHKPKMNISKNLLNIFRPIWNQKLSNTIFRLSVIDDQGLTSCTYLSQKDLSLSLKAWSHKVGDVKNAIFFIGSRMKSSFSLSKKKKRFIQMTWAFTCALRTFSLLVKAKKGSVSILIRDEERA